MEHCVLILPQRGGGLGPAGSRDLLLTSLNTHISETVQLESPARPVSTAHSMQPLPNYKLLASCFGL